MAYYLRNGSSFTVSSKKNLDLYEQLPAATYTIKKDIYDNLFLEIIEDFAVSGKMYGDIEDQATRILTTFGDRPASTGVMLAGEKGSGKSLLAKMISANGIAQGIPTIVINTPWCGDKFNTFIQSIDQPVILLFDEFEKVYGHEEQEQILTLLDGVFPSKKLFMLTCNDKWRIDQHMRNRPGRIYYMIDFDGLSTEFVREYCHDNLINKEHIETMCNFASVFSKFNFDMLKAIVEEMNRFGETPELAIRWLNTKPEFSSRVDYAVTLQGKTITVTEYEKSWSGNPLSSAVCLEYNAGPDSDGDNHWNDIVFEKQHLVSVNGRTKTFEFENEKAKLTLTALESVHYNYFGAF
jgi:hypothetical protein